jgi:adenylosuccinate synthase
MLIGFENKQNSQEIPELAVYLKDVSEAINKALENNENILFRYQGTYLSLYYGDYPT